MNKNRMKFNITLSPESRTVKPADHIYENGLICQKNETVVTKEEMMKYLVAPHSRTWCCSTLTDTRNTKYFKSLQTIAVDIDNKPGVPELSPEELINRAEEHGMDVSFIHTSFSDTPEYRRYRAIWILDKEITDVETAKICIKTVYNLFPEADHTTDVVRLWYGGKEIIHKSDYILTIEKIDELGFLNSINGVSIKKKAAKAKIYRGKKGKALYNTIRDFHKSPQFEESNKLKNFDWEYATSIVSILKEFTEGHKKIYHKDLFFLSSNLYRISGGEKLFNKCIEKNPLINDEKKNIMYYIKYRWKEGYPIYPNSFGSLPTNHKDYHLQEEYNNLLSVRPHNQYSKAKLLTHKPTVNLTKARNMLETKFREALEAKDNNIYIFRCATGLGKTQLAIQEIGIAMFFPTHDLKEEMSKKSTIPHLCTPAIPEMDKLLRTRYLEYCNAGLHNYATRSLYDYVEEHDPDSPHADNTIYDGIKNYLDQIEKCKEATDTIYSTHAKGIYSNFENKSTYIFDEDPLNTMIQVKSCSTVSLRKLANILTKMDNISDATTIRNIATQIKENSISSFSDSLKPDFIDVESVEQAIMSASRKSLNKNYIGDNLYSFLLTPNVKFTTRPLDEEDPDGDKLISYISYTPLKEDKKYIFLSATADEWIYKKLYKDRVKFIDLSTVELQGDIIQFSDRSFSRNGMMRLQANRAKIANDFLPDLHTITLKSYKNNFKNAVDDLHFGKCEGSNIYSGQDIKVVGTPHMNPEVIKLYCKLLGISTSPLDFEFKKQKIQHNGFEFNFPTSLNEEVRKIQFHFIERELIQAIGRSRLLNNVCTVYLFSDYPIPHAEQKSLKDIQDGSQKVA